MNCEFCGRVCNTNLSLGTHRSRCPSNPNRVILRPNLGNKHSPEAVEKCRVAAQSKHDNGLGTPPPSWLGRTHTSESKQKISSSLAGNRNANHRGDRQSYYDGDLRMDSRWEVSTANYLQENNYAWRYSPSGFMLSDGRVYYPDFFTYDLDDKLDHLIEVKGYFREENKQKFEQFKSEYPEIHIELWQKTELKERGII